MKKVFPALSFALILGAQVLAVQAQTKNVRAAKPSKEKAASVVPVNNPENKAEQTTPEGFSPSPSSVAATPIVPAGENSATTDAPGKTLATVPVAPPPPPESIYRVGAGDVLDIRLLNAQSRESTLFTIMAGGLLEYPLAGEPLQVGGLTPDEVAARLTAGIKVYENPQLVVSVRDYASHSVIVTGLVNDPGTKFLRREAVPLYVVLAEAQPRPEAGRATIMRSGAQSRVVELADTTATGMLIFPGDVITLAALPPAPAQFFYIGGQIVSPGQKDFHAGMTLTQAVMASGGVTRFAGSKVKIARQGADGLLIKTEHNLKQIEDGKLPDPVLQPGDRIEITRGGW